ncbi:hypothetical protein GCM10027418_25900 [Mariniluteicoccus endophyticus]
MTSSPRPPARVRRRVLAAVAAATLATGCTTAAGDGQEGFVSGSTGLTRVEPAKRRVAPVAKGPGLEGGEVTTSHPGKVVVINVWGSWCAPCRKEAPDLQKAAEETQDVARFVGIDTRDPDPAPALAFQRSFGVTYPSIHDPEATQLLVFSDELPPSGIPSTLVIDTQGRIAARVIGVVDRATLVGLVRDTAEGR